MHTKTLRPFMKAIILSAGQGRRLSPLTDDRPKCVLPVHGKSIIEWQIDELLRCGVDDVVVVLGYGIEQVESQLAKRYGPGRIRVLYNPFFEVADNLASCWMARDEMHDDFVLLNGDTLFDAAVLDRLLASAQRPIVLATDIKPGYDADDMKVQLDGTNLCRIGKDLPAEQVNGESIGMLHFRGRGPALFRCALEEAMRRPRGLRQWYLSVIDGLARHGHVGAECIHGLAWAEVDFPADLEYATTRFADLAAERQLSKSA